MKTIQLAPAIRARPRMSAAVSGKGIGLPFAENFEEPLDRFLLRIVTTRQQALDTELRQYADLPLDQVTLQLCIGIHRLLVHANYLPCPIMRTIIFAPIRVDIAIKIICGTRNRLCAKVQNSVGIS